MTFGPFEGDREKMGLKVPVVYLNSPTDFNSWHVSLRRLVKGLSMGDALMFSMEAQLSSFKSRKEQNAKEFVMKEEESESKAKELQNEYQRKNTELEQRKNNETQQLERKYLLEKKELETEFRLKKQRVDINVYA